MFRFNSTILRAPADGAGGEGFFKEGAAQTGQQTGQQDDQGQSQTGDKATRPDWLLQKYNTVEDQAKGYNELYGQYSRKTDDLRKDLLADAVKEYGKTVGVPDDPSAYTYPDGYQAPSESVDKALRDWAKKHNVPPAGFQELVKDVHGITTANHEAEKQKLGEKADDRVADVNRWVNANVDKAHFPQVAKLMTTADGVAFIESLIEGRKESGFATDGGQQQSTPLTRDGIRALQADQRFGQDQAYTDMVRKKWADYANLPDNKRK